MFGLSFGEVLIIGIIALVLFGKEDLPQTLRKFTKGFQEFKKVTHEAQRSWQDVKDDVSRTIMQADIEEDVRRNLREAEEKVRVGLNAPLESTPSQESALSQDSATLGENKSNDLPSSDSVNVALDTEKDEDHNPDGTLKIKVPTDIVGKNS
jgi:Sec-independent protein translocase protein TatA